MDIRERSMRAAIASPGRGQRLVRFVGIASVALALSTPAFAAPHGRQAASARVLDILRVQAVGDASKAVVTLPGGPEQVHRCDAVIIGGGMGGVSAAYEAARAGLSVCMTEPTLWIGGQMTSEGVSAFDDNKWIDTTGATATYSDLSRRIREF